MITWKKASRHETKPLPGDLFLLLQAAIGEHFDGFDFLTVPAPSFHTYEHYPIWDVALTLGASLNIPVMNLFPNNSGKTKMGSFSSIGKQVQNIDCQPGKFVLILDDILTTGHTLRVSCEAICRKGSYPVGLAIG
jgi:hypothetical protein